MTTTVRPGALARRAAAAATLSVRRLLAPRHVVADRLREKAEYCRRVDAPLYARLLEAAAQDVLARGACWRALEGRERDPSGSAIALRFMGSVHRLVLEGRAPELSEYYPSVGGHRDPAGAVGAFLELVQRYTSDIRRLTDHPLQTNEIGRSSALLGGFLLIARETGLPLRLLEIGASAGLNLRWDQYRYASASDSWGTSDSPVVLDLSLPAGSPLLEVSPSIVERRGCDLAPVDPRRPEDRLRLMSYVWPEHIERFRVLHQALALAAHRAVEVDRANATEWLPEQLREPRPGTATVVFHTIVMQFMSATERRKIQRIIAGAGGRATTNAPLAWLRMEEGGSLKDVLLSTWPAGHTRRIARAGLHGVPVHWLETMPARGRLPWELGQPARAV